MSQKLFKELSNKTTGMLKAGQKFNSYGKNQYPFAKLPELGISNYKELSAEYKKVKKKQSNLSSNGREAVLNCYLLIDGNKELRKLKKEETKTK